VKYYLLLYGIGRDLNNVKSTIDFFRSLEPNINVVYHYLKIDNVSNPRTKEKGHICYDGIDLITRQTKEVLINDSIKTPLYNYSKEFVDGHNDNYKSNNNLLNQLLILDSFSDIIKRLSAEDLIVVFRDDIKFDKLSAFILKYSWKKIIKSNNVFVSAFSWHGGINDKFFISKKNNTKILITRINHVKDSINHFQHLNAEELILYLVNKMNLALTPLFCRVGRVRINGLVKWDPFYPSITRIKDIFRVLKKI
jgi:hypothetical protein